MRFSPKEQLFFDLLETQAANLHRGAQLVVATLEGYSDLDAACGASKAIHDIEHAGDVLVHDLIARLNHSFITPFDREDIYALTRGLDDILDFVDASAERLVIFRIDKPTPYATELSRIIQRCTAEIEHGVRLLRNLRDPEPLLRLCARVSKLENDGDQVLREALAHLFDGDRVEPLDVVKWKDIYENLETATDKCADVADILHTVIVKYA